MSASTTLTLSRVSSFDETQYKSSQYGYQSGGHNHNQNIANNAVKQPPATTTNHNNNITTSASYYHLPGENRQQHSLSYSKTEPLALYIDDASPTTSQERTSKHYAQINNATPTTGLLLHKSNSYNGMVSLKPKATIIKQDSLNGRINTSLTDSDSEYGSAMAGFIPTCSPTTPMAAATAAGTSSMCANEAIEEHDSFLVGSTSSTCNDAASSSSSSGNTNRNRRSNRSNSKNRSSICFRANAFVSRNWYLSYLVPLSILLALMFVAYLTRDYAKRLLFWIETQNPWVIFAVFMLLFIIVSFPIVVGYFVLMITAGYLFGLIRGFLTVILGANMGIAIAHLTLRSLKHRLPVQKLIKNETGRAILRVISGPRAFRVVLFTRLTPIPFGIQNAIFGVSTINPKVYHTATFLGLLPAQLINVYLGSTLRSMHEVLNNHGTAITGYISFGVEVICGIALMFWVVQKARKELSETLLTDIGNDGKLIDIQV
ncbi:transmembrane protein 64 isoform X1 [Stomoxys calcitrans]|uniref:transmembrane protein 64 isoform X1 n=1 Tax=Stomoxys calcitrans TaxID=35570 RepID=UPI0027E341BF|nr:transmembrane protein 64 isoform X1 [Stomoxys calcitrans]XP_059219652.1 transmembrane protein 64 isoform X1 [Stomoxys calcitrans]XP_059219655.1 transmembrane protein 64 isoform X1 [Stomoxys calcitrans]XP_059219658.1 transmembrane protein 64 isoform X1 [Stomoxys calcitrans]